MIGIALKLLNIIKLFIKRQNAAYVFLKDGINSAEQPVFQAALRYFS